MGTGAALIAVSAIAAGLQVSESRRQRKRADQVTREQAARQDQLIREREKKEKQNRERARSQTLLGRRTNPSRTRGGTILTSPLGITNQSGKTALGE